jgi:putative MFS transporter
MTSSPTEAATSERPRPTLIEAIESLPNIGLSLGAWIALMLGFFFALYEVGVYALVVPSIRGDLGLTGTNLGWPVTWNLIGYCLGAALFGYIADRAGRQIGMALTYAVLGLGGLLSGFSWDVVSLSATRFIAGAGIGAVFALSAVYIGEMVRADHRGRYLARMYLVSGIISIIVGFASLPVLAWSAHWGWRFLLIFGGLAILIVPLVNRRDIVESPRWLIEKGRVENAARIVRMMQARAGTESTVDFADTPRWDKTTAREVFRELSKPRYMRRLLLVFVFWFVLYIGVYGAAAYSTLVLEGVGISTSEALFISVLSRFAPLVAGVVLVIVIERFERRTLIIAGALIDAIGLVMVVSGWGAAGAIVGMLLISAGLNMLLSPAYIYTAEVFPTRSRSTAAAVTDGLGHLGGAVAPFIVLPLLTGFGAVAANLALAAAFVVAAIVIMFGPRTRGRTLEEVAPAD